jgi:hypothetical protein
MDGGISAPQNRTAHRGIPTVAIVGIAISASILFSGYTLYYAKHHPVKEIVFVDKWGEVRRKVISATVTAFQSQNKLMVKSMEGNVRVKATKHAWFLTGTQEISMPASVDYVVDLRAVKVGDVNYDPYTKTLFIKFPPVQLGSVALKMDKATQVDGGLLTMNDQVRQELSKINFQAANTAFTNLAKEQVRLDAARVSAQKNISSLLEIPLKATGNGDISVRAY